MPMCQHQTHPLCPDLSTTQESLWPGVKNGLSMLLWPLSLLAEHCSMVAKGSLALGKGWAIVHSMFADLVFDQPIAANGDCYWL